MQWMRPRDTKGRFLKAKISSHKVQSSECDDMSGRKRTRSSEDKYDPSLPVSPSISPASKKSLAEDTAEWRSVPELSHDFYPQYLRHQRSSNQVTSPKSSSIPTRSTGTEGASANVSTQDNQCSYKPLNQETSLHDKTVMFGKVGDSSQVNERCEYHSSDSVIDGTPQVEFSPGGTGINTDSNPTDYSQEDKVQALNTSPDNQMTQMVPRATIGQDNVIVLSNSKGIPINTVDLEGVMTRVMSQVMGKLDSMSTELKQVPVIRAATAKLDRELIQVRQDCHGIKESVNDLKKKEEDNVSKHEALVKEVKAIKSDLLNRPVDGMKENNPNIPLTEMDRLKREAVSRRNNLIIEGISEPSEDEGVLTAVSQIKSFFTETLHLPKFEIASAFRLGKFRQESTRPRPIKVQFLHPSDRETVWRAKAILARNKDFKHSIKEDLPPKLCAQMSALIRVSQIARRYPDLYKNVWINDFQIYINGSAYSADQLESLPSKLRPSVSSTPGNINAVVFYGRDSKLSNHFQCKFTWDNRDFGSIEQYLAYRRAHIAERKDLAIQAMGSQDPADAKRIMNILKSSPSDPDWREQCRDILFSGLMAKFSQNEYLMRYLLESGQRKLGEASLDKTWGIGMSLLDHQVLDPTKWVGANLLGVTLMEVREELRSWVHRDTDPSVENPGRSFSG